MHGANTSPSRVRTRRVVPFHAVAVLPATLVVVLVGLAPAVQSLLLSLSSYSLQKAPGEFVGLLNYWTLVTADPVYLRSLTFTFGFALAATVAETGLGLIVALLLADKQIGPKTSSVSRTLMMVPFVIAPVVVSYAYKTLLFDGTFGYLNYLLRTIGLPEFFVFDGAINAPIALLVMEVLLRTPFMVLILYAGIMTVNPEMLDAAEVDNATGLQRIRHIILPTIGPIILVGFVLRFMDALKMFDEVFVLTAGGPGYNTYNVSLFTARIAFDSPFRFGYAAAASFLFTVVVILLTLLVFRFFRLESARSTVPTLVKRGWLRWQLARVTENLRSRLPSRPAPKQIRRMTHGQNVVLKTLSKWIKQIALALYLVVSLMPFVLLVMTSVKDAKIAMAMPPVWFFVPNFENYVALLTKREFLTSLMNSAVVAVAATLFSTAAGTLTAYAFARFRFRGASLLSFLILTMRMIPPIALVIPYYLMWQQLGLRDTYVALVAMYVALSLPIVVWMMYSFFLDFPVEIEEAAIVDGASRWRTFTQVVVPAMYPSILASSTLAFLMVWNEFILAQYNTGRATRTLPVEIYSQLGVFGFDWGVLSASAVIAVIPAVVFFALTQRHLVRGLTMGAVKG